MNGTGELSDPNTAVLPDYKVSDYYWYPGANSYRGVNPLWSKVYKGKTGNKKKGSGTATEQTLIANQFLQPAHCEVKSRRLRSAKSILEALSIHLALRGLRNTRSILAGSAQIPQL